MSKDSLIYTVEVLDANTRYTLTELCSISRLAETVVTELLDYEVIVADGPTGNDFSHAQLLRLMKASRLLRDLEINMPGIALVIDLMETNKRLERRLKQLEVLNMASGDMPNIR